MSGKYEYSLKLKKGETLHPKLQPLLRKACLVQIGLTTKGPHACKQTAAEALNPEGHVP